MKSKKIKKSSYRWSRIYWKQFSRWIN